MTAKICAALNVECDDNLEFIQRVREKKSILSEKTDDETIIDNAVSTALNHEDLAALIQMDYKTIYLCGELFNVPIRIAGVKYIGILGTPKIKIRAKSQEELDAKQISFEKTLRRVSEGFFFAKCDAKFQFQNMRIDRDRFRFFAKPVQNRKASQKYLRCRRLLESNPPRRRHLIFRLQLR